MSLSFIEKCREIFSNSEIKILIRKDIFPLIEENCRFLKITPIFYRKKNLKETISLIKKIKKERFDCCFLLPRSYRMFLIAVLSAIKNIYGYADFFKKPFFTKYLIRNEDSLKKHRVEYYLDILRLYKDFGKFKAPNIQISNSHCLWAKNFLRENNVKNKFIIGVNPGATYGLAKCWKRENFYNLCKALTEFDNNIFFIIFGGKDNIEYNAYFDTLQNSLNVTGKISLIQTAALIKECRLFITNDTGPMHIADALGIEIVAIFGPTDPNETPPFKMKNFIVYKNIECSPCKERDCPKRTHRCMEEISVDEVKELIVKEIYYRRNYV